MAKRQAYVLNGSLPQVLRSFDGITNWLVGMILVDRTSKESRVAAKEKMIYALKLGASIIMYPEGTWNKSPNELMSGLFPGIYDVAKESGALLVPIATYRNGNKAYGIMDEAFDICSYDREVGITVLRDKMASLKYEMMEKYGQCKRSEFPYGKQAEVYWENYINDLMAEAEFYEEELERHTKYRPKGVTSPKEAFEFMNQLEPNRRNAFLWRKNV